jgi:hypothetical protein
LVQGGGSCTEQMKPKSLGIVANKAVEVKSSGNGQMQQKAEWTSDDVSMTFAPTGIPALIVTRSQMLLGRPRRFGRAEHGLGCLA